MSAIKTFFLGINNKEIYDILKRIFTLATGGIVLRFIPFLMTPLILNAISPEQYGLIALIQSFISFVVIFSGLGLRQVLFINFFHCTTDRRKEIINNIVIIYLMFAIPLLLLGLLNSTIVSALCMNNHANNTVIWLALLICFISFFSELYYQTLTLLGKTTQLILIQAVIGIITAIMNLMFVIGLELTITGIFMGQLIALVFVNCLGFHWYLQQAGYKYLNIANAIKSIKEYFEVGTVFIPSMLFGWILSSSNRWFLAHYATLHEVGIYSLADSIGQLYQLLVMLPINNAYLPALLKKYSENKQDLLQVERWNQKLLYSFMACALGGVAITSWVVPLVLHSILPAKYNGALLYIQALLVSYVFWTGTSFTFALVFYMKYIYSYLIAILASCLINLSFNFLLVPQYKIYGSVCATVISYLAYFLISFLCNSYVKNQISHVPDATLNLKPFSPSG